MVAFGKTLPLSLRRKPFTENVQEKWLTSFVYYDKIASMAGIWEGIEDLQYVLINSFKLLIFIKRIKLKLLKYLTT